MLLKCCERRVKVRTKVYKTICAEASIWKARINIYKVNYTKVNAVIINNVRIATKYE